MNISFVFLLDKAAGFRHKSPLMKPTKSPFHPKALLWWVAIIALGVSGALFYFLKEQAKYDGMLDQRRLLFPLIGVIIAGVCAIAGTAGRCFYPK
jgi:hypothetical protein